MMLYYTLDLLHIAGCICSSGLIIASFFIVTTPVSPLIAVGTVIIGIALYHWLYYYSFALIIGSYCIYIAMRRNIQIQTLHAVACALCAVFTLWVDHQRFIIKKELLQNGPHTLSGLIIDRKKWLQTQNGWITTIKLSQVDDQEIDGIFKFFTYTDPQVKVGNYSTFFQVKTALEDDKKNLASYALRDHQLGICFSPIIHVKGLPITTSYSRWMSWWHAWREDVYNRIKSLLPPKVFTYTSALFFGNKNRVDFLDIRAKFSRWGLTHYLARSGLHISLLVSLWVGMLHFLPIPLPVKAIILCVLLFIYDHLSWASISFNRALWLWLFYLGSWFTNSSVTPVFGLAQLSLIILLYNPWQAGCLDFQLSFFLTLVLMLYGYYRQKLFLLSSCAKKKN